jgi:hypothetical protein
MPEIPFIGRPFLTQSFLVDANLYVDLDVETKEQTLYMRPGLTPWLNTGVQAPVRNMLGFGNFLYAIVGPNVYIIDQYGNQTLLGQLKTSTGYVWIEPNSHQLMIVDGEFGYLINVISTTLNTPAWTLYNNQNSQTIYDSGTGSGAAATILTFGTYGGTPGYYGYNQTIKVSLTSGGSSYSSGVNIVPSGGGSGCNFTATVKNGVIISISVSGTGSYYTQGSPLNFGTPETTYTNTNTTIYQTTLSPNVSPPTLVYDSVNDVVLLQNDSLSFLQPGQYYYDGVSILYVYLSTGLAPTGIIINQPSTNGFIQIPNPGMIGAQSLAMIDDYFVVSYGSEFQPSSPDDGTNWDALNFATKEGYPDAIVCVFSDHRELWLFGETTTEVWYDAGTFPFPFAQVPSGYLETGCGAAASPAKVDEGIFWFTNKGQVVRAVQYSPQVVSSRRMEWNIAQYPVTSDAIGWACFHQGRAQYHLSFPTAGVTWVYEPQTQHWHRRLSQGTTGNWRANCCTSFQGNWLVGDYETGIIYELDQNNFQDNGQPIDRIWTFPTIEDKGKRVPHQRLEFLIEAGMGDTANDVPQMALSWSNDGEKTFGNEVWRSPGKVGNYMQRIVYDRLGIPRKRTYRIRQTDNCPTVILEVALNEGL